MKRTVNVTIIKELEIDIPDELLTKEEIEMFNDTMWNINGPDDLFAYAARYIALYDDGRVEGLGCVAYTTPFTDVETEVME